jgi:hypothetical protein
LRHEIIKQHSKQRLVAFFSFELNNIPLCGFLHNYGLLFRTASRFLLWLRLRSATKVSAPLSHQSVGSAQPPKCRLRSATKVSALLSHQSVGSAQPPKCRLCSATKVSAPLSHQSVGSAQPPKGWLCSVIEAQQNDQYFNELLNIKELPQMAK